MIPPRWASRAQTPERSGTRLGTTLDQRRRGELGISLANPQSTYKFRLGMSPQGFALLVWRVRQRAARKKGDLQNTLGILRSSQIRRTASYSYIRANNVHLVFSRETKRPGKSEATVKGSIGKTRSDLLPVSHLLPLRL